MSSTLAVQIIRGLFHLDISFTCLFRVIRALIFIFWSLLAEEIDGVGDKELGDITVVAVQTLGGFVDIPEMCPFH